MKYDSVQIVNDFITEEARFHGIPGRTSGTTAKKTTKDWLQKETPSPYDQIRNNHKGAYKPWTTELDDELTVMYCEGVTVKDMAKHFGRTKGTILSRIIKLELEDL